MALHSFFKDGKLIFQLSCSITIISEDIFINVLETNLPFGLLNEVAPDLITIFNTPTRHPLTRHVEFELVNEIAKRIESHRTCKLFFYPDYAASLFSEVELLKKYIIAQNSLKFSQEIFWTEENNPMFFYCLCNEWLFSFFYKRQIFDLKVREILPQELHSIISITEAVMNVFLDKYSSDCILFTLKNKQGNYTFVMTEPFNMQPLLFVCY
jgi:hypothetical protein